jgi:hypothetical protein
LEKLLGSPIVVTLIVPLLLNVPALPRPDASVDQHSEDHEESQHSRRASQKGRVSNEED